MSGDSGYLITPAGRTTLLEGQVGAQVGAQTVEAGPGDVLVEPRGVPHGLRVPGPA
jgi:quercetin dioxygenase-like cupin family protein